MVKPDNGNSTPYPPIGEGRLVRLPDDSSPPYPDAIRSKNFLLQARVFVDPSPAAGSYPHQPDSEMLKMAEKVLRKQIALLKSATFVADNVEVAVPLHGGRYPLNLKLLWRPVENRPIDNLFRAACQLIELWDPGIVSGALFRRAIWVSEGARDLPHSSPLSKGINEPAYDSSPRNLARLVGWYAKLNEGSAQWPSLSDRKFVDVVPAEALRRLKVSIPTNATVAQVLDLSELAHTPPTSALLDDGSEEVLTALLKEGWRRTSSGVSADDNLLEISLKVSNYYVLRALPGLVDLPLELILEWRSKLAHSLSAFSAMVNDMAAIAHEADAKEYSKAFKSIAHHLDREYLELERSARSSSLWRITREKFPTMGGTSAGLSLTLGLGAHNVVLAATALASASLSQCIAIALEALQRKRRLSDNPLYWRYYVGSE